MVGSLMIDDTQFWRRGRPKLRHQPEPPPQSTSAQLLHQTTDALAEQAYPPLSGTVGHWARASQPLRWHPQILRILHSGVVSKGVQSSHRQHQPVTSYPRRVAPAGGVGMADHPP